MVGLTLRWPRFTSRASLERPRSATEGGRAHTGHSQIFLGDIDEGLPAVEALRDQTVQVLRDAQPGEDRRQGRHGSRAGRRRGRRARSDAARVKSVQRPG